MKQKMYLLAVLLFSTYCLHAQKPTDEDPYLLWQTTDPEGYESFIVHPNGNIIAMKGLIISELNGNTGEVIRVFNIKAPVGDISPDGKYLLIITDSVTIIDYETEAVVKKLSVPGSYPYLRYFPDGKRIIYCYQKALGTGLDSMLVVYDLIKDEYTFLDLNYSSPAIATSSDGRYFATGGWWKEKVGIEEKYFTYLNLWDAITLKPIKQLGKFEGNSEVRSIKFSPDGKYVGFQISILDIKVYDLNNFSIIKNYLGGMFDFINSNYFAYYSSNWPTAPPDIMIKSIIDDKLIYSKRAKNGGNDINHNFVKNTLLYLDSGQLWALDLNKILTSVLEPNKQAEISTQYKNGILTITHLSSISGQIKIKISDISGRIIKELNPTVIGTEFKISLKLPNGTYLIHIYDGNKEYSSKFLVTE